MYLKKIELRGFKSFPNKTEILFNSGITSIVGPNGSGKSNISDAVRWVLGEQSIKSLRGEKSEDVIFSGTDSKNPMSFAEVSITIDNCDRILDIDYSEITIKRRVYRSGESEYSINSQQCRLRDIKEMLLSTGIGKEGYSIIEQGKIDEILSGNQSARRRLFDEATGISKYRYKKEEAQRKLEKTRENLERINDIYYEIEKHIRPLEVQRNKALRYTQVESELRSLEVRSFALQIKKLGEELKAVDETLQAAENESRRLEEQKACEYDEYALFKSKHAAACERLEKLSQGMYSVKEAIEKTASQIRLYAEKKSSVQNLVQKNDSELCEARASSEELFNELELSKARLAEFKNEMSLLISSRDKARDESSLNSSDITNGELEIEELKNRAIELLDEKNARAVRISSEKAIIDAALRRRGELDKDKAELCSLNTLKENEAAVLKDRLDTLKASCEEAKAQNRKKREALSDASKSIAELSEGIRSLQLEIKDKSSRLAVYESMERQLEGYNRGVKEALTSGIAGIEDVVANIIDVKREHETAIEIALGAALQNIITKDEESAKRAVEYLKQKGYGRATFLPLSVYAKKVHGALEIGEGLEGFIGIASALVGCSDKYRPVVESLLGKTLVVSDMDCAIAANRKTGYRHRLVTLDGQIFNPGGSISGGSVKKAQNSILSRSRIIDEFKCEIEKLQSELLKANSQEESLKTNHAKIDIDLRAGLGRLGDIEKEILRVSAQIEGAVSSMKESSDKAQRLISESERISSEIQIHNERAILAEKETREIELKIADIQERLKSETEKIRERSETKKASEKELSQMEAKIAGLEAYMAAGEGEVERLRSALESKGARKKALEAENASLVAQLESLGKSSANSEGELAYLETELRQMDLQISELSGEKIMIEKSVEEKLGNVRRLEEAYAASREELIKAQTRRAGIQREYEGICDTLYESYAMTYEEALQESREGDIPNSARIRQLKSEIREIGSVNLESIEEYEKEKERYELYKSQKSDMENSIGELEGLIESIESSMTSEFMANFEKINSKFETVFTELFGGGGAQLRLENPQTVLESDIEIDVMPPGKKLKSITLMSGGEKALTAIAVMFSILLTKPTPFCILDEIEAALDDSNIARFGVFLKTLSSNTQFVAITHRMGTMEVSDYIYGVTMEENGISKLLTLKLEDAERFADEKTS